jgi:sulfatase maturation enzyme AslB (radical SAM superfamily)
MAEIKTIEDLSLVLTAQCNSRCSYCYQNAKNDRAMEWETLRASIDLALRLGGRNTNLVFLGGEPLLRFAAIRRAVAYLDRKGRRSGRVQFHISTNGLLVDRDIASFLTKHKFEVYLSFDGVEQAQEFRKQGSFRLIDALLDRLRLQEPDLFARRLRVGITLIPAAVPFLAESVRYLMDKGVRRIAVSPSLIHHGDWRNERIQELDSQFFKVSETSLRHLRETGEIPVLYLRRRRRGIRRKSACRAMCSFPEGRRLLVDVDGQVYGCAAVAESYQVFPSDLLEKCLAPLKMGDVRDPAFRKRHEAFRKAARKTEIFQRKQNKYSSYGRCRDCEYVGLCAVCPVSIGYDPANSDPRRVPDFVCAFNRVASKYRNLFPPTEE